MRTHIEFIFGAAILFLMAAVLWRFIDDEVPPEAIVETPPAQQEEGVNGQPTAPTQEAVTAEEVMMLQNATYFLWGEPKQFVGGEYELLNEEEAISEIASLYPTPEAPLMVKSDLDNDGAIEYAVIATINTGGTGNWRGLHIFDREGKQLAVHDLGDRVLINDVQFHDGYLQLDMVVQGPNDGACCPTEEVYTRFRFDRQTNELMNVDAPEAADVGDTEGSSGDAGAEGSDPLPTEETAEEPVACTMDAKMCPDGSFVGRVGPNCEFAPCPGAGTATPSVNYCEPRMSGEDIACIEIYAPVCGLVQVECVTTPCDPVPQTFSNSCYACRNDRVISYTEGACEGGI